MHDVDCAGVGNDIIILYSTVPRRPTELAIKAHRGIISRGLFATKTGPDCMTRGKQSAPSEGSQSVVCLMDYCSKVQSSEAASYHNRLLSYA